MSHPFPAQVGITPALAILRAFEQTRRVNIIWITRDASMVEFYLTAIDFDTDAFTCVYYTGNRKLRLGALPPNVLVFEGLRPDLELTLRTIIWGIETGNGLPEDMVETSEKAKRDGEAFASSLAADEAATDPMARTEAALRRALLASSVDDVLAQFVGVESPAATPRAPRHATAQTPDSKVLVATQGSASRGSQSLTAPSREPLATRPCPTQATPATASSWPARVASDADRSAVQSLTVASAEPLATRRATHSPSTATQRAPRSCSPKVSRAKPSRS